MPAYRIYPYDHVLGPLASPDIRTGALVSCRLSLVDVDQDARVGLRGITGNGSEVVGAGSCAAGAGNLDLGAFGVELGRVCLVKSEQLMADEVVTRLDVGRDLAGPLQVLVDDSSSPVVAVQDGACETLLIDLEPLLVLSCA